MNGPGHDQRSEPCVRGAYSESMLCVRAHKRVLALNGKTIEWRHDALIVGTKANRARFKGMSALSNWPRNRLLLALPSRNLKRLMPELEQIRCEREQVLLDADSSLDHVFFPDIGVISGPTTRTMSI